MTIDTSKLPKTDINLSYETNLVSTMDSTPYTITFDSTSEMENSPTAITLNNSTPITWSTGTGPEWNNVGNWPSELIINDMIKKYPGLKLQYEKFMTVYNLIKDEYKYEEPINDGSV